MLLKNNCKNFVMILSFVSFIIVQFALVYILNMDKYMYGTLGELPTYFIVFGMILFIAEIIFIIIARVKKAESILKGFFLFKLIGIFAFVICLFLRMGDTEIEGSFFFYVYSVWTVYLCPFSRIMQVLVGVSEFLRKALILSIITYISGVAFLGIKKQQKFEREMAERKELENV